MTAKLSAAAVATIQGTQDGQRLVAVIREGCAPADALRDGILQVLATEDADRLMGLCRQLQKSLEGRA
jgi:hypothetical protein